ncbi:hypothetical protein E2C00_05915 [Streptomyces sp. WAC05374]|uniref:hypothetical protein n=1 Tax=Streptomyces sp. WAC05374 TaxID=2487420 RepID=UPI000F8960F8|nr:hypothetical protein [Streptomyces sp. WAC05374]RST11355.1 hypothetical protein EF905_25375 [Streptomyces sp. WAC05374]TDF44280.1 hypothetical protein E2B92_16330 [Streptomyces sp. WAC05374]TDF53790.1 hypothetical protein E2C02_18565 [Streptomyces sp. WAC05374]TDF58622.1 hypothetical protein E2C00_05915 [Streptomyces sp. WAC05374]
MSLISTLARLEAVESGRAQPLATVRHRHLSERPLVLVPLTTAGEAGAPLGALVGTDPERPALLVVPQPRDRDLRFGFLADLAEAVLPYVDGYADSVEAAERNETDPETGRKVRVEVELCADAPQLIVPSRAGIEYVRLLGRSMRFRRTAEQDPETPFPAPPRVPLLGRWLTHYGERARVPGSSLLLAATDLLNRHWATGQSSLEDQHLGALLAWIDPPAGASGAEAALRAELARDREGQLVCPPAGPATDPAFDNRLLAPAVERYDRARQALAAAEDGEAADVRLGELHRAEREIRELILSQLRPTWDGVWRAIGLLRALPPGARVADRWTRDRWSFTGHRDRVRAGEPPQPRRDDAVTAANKLAARESAQAQLEAQEALDDPLVLAGRRLAGEAFVAEVVEVTMAWSESKRPSPRPLLTVRTDDRPHLGERVKVYRSLDGKPQAAQFVRYEEDGSLVLRLLDRMGRSKEPAEGSVPGKGDRLAWTLFEHDQRVGPKLPDPEETPWTHGGPPRTDLVEVPDAVTPEDLL